MVDPEPALANLAQLERLGALGPYGFRDAIDYTRPEPEQPLRRGPRLHGASPRHGSGRADQHPGSGVWQRRFHADPVVRSAELLLHERIPRRLVLREPQRARPDEAMPEPDLEQPAVRRLDTPDTPQPHIALLGEPPYTIMVSHCGGGYSRYESLAVTRWRADGCRDATGQFQYVKDLSTGRVWSAAHQPVCAPPDWYHADLATDRVTFQRADGAIETSTEIAVVPEDSAEVRRVTVTNNSDERARGRAHQLRRDRARPARDRPRASRVRQPVRRDRVARLVYRDHRHPASALRDRAAALVRARGGHAARSASGR